jgi:hypothetical protein
VKKSYKNSIKNIQKLLTSEVALYASECGAFYGGFLVPQKITVAGVRKISY